MKEFWIAYLEELQVIWGGLKETNAVNMVGAGIENKQVIECSDGRDVFNFILAQVKVLNVLIWTEQISQILNWVLLLFQVQACESI